MLLMCCSVALDANSVSEAISSRICGGGARVWGWGGKEGGEGGEGGRRTISPNVKRSVYCLPHLSVCRGTVRYSRYTHPPLPQTAATAAVTTTATDRTPAPAPAPARPHRPPADRTDQVAELCVELVDRGLELLAGGHPARAERLAREALHPGACMCPVNRRKTGSGGQRPVSTRQGRGQRRARPGGKERKKRGKGWRQQRDHTVPQRLGRISHHPPPCPPPAAPPVAPPGGAPDNGGGGGCSTPASLTPAN